MQDHSKPIWFTKKENKPIKTHELKPKKFSIFVATPCHSDVSLHYFQACLEFQKHCIKNNVLCCFQVMKSSLVTQGRNLCVAEMLNHVDNYTHLLFIDSDIDFEFTTIEKMLATDKDIISCPYPMKSFDWDKTWRRFTTKEDAITKADDLPKSGLPVPHK